MSIPEFFLLLLGFYLIGAIPTGVILTRLTGHGDIRQTGSGNIGATNVYRVAGRKLGILTLVGDTLKGVLPMLYIVASPFTPLQVGAAALALFLGHCFPVYLRFKGGKGVATALGIFLVLTPTGIFGSLLIFAGFLWKWRYISMASIAAAAVTPFMVLLTTRSLPIFFASFAIGALVIIRHSGNIQRLRNGTESRFRA